MRVLVTGATGYIGASVISALQSAGHHPVAMIHEKPLRHDLEIEAIAGNLRSLDSLMEAMRNIDAVIHLAGLRSTPESIVDPLSYYEINLAGTISLARAMVACDVRRLVFASTGLVEDIAVSSSYDTTVRQMSSNVYASTKLASEVLISALAESGAIGASILRFFNVAGGFDPDSGRIVPRVISAAASGQDSCVRVIGGKDVARDFLHVEDVASAFLAAMQCIEIGKCGRYRLSSGRLSTVGAIVEAAKLVTGSDILLICDGDDRARAGVGLMDVTPELRWSPQKSELENIVRDAWSARARSST